MTDLSRRVGKLEQENLTGASLWRDAYKQWDPAHPEKMIDAVRRVKERAERLVMAGRSEFEGVAKLAALLERYYGAIYAGR